MGMQFPYSLGDEPHSRAELELFGTRMIAHARAQRVPGEDSIDNVKARDFNRREAKRRTLLHGVQQSEISSPTDEYDQTAEDLILAKERKQKVRAAVIDLLVNFRTDVIAKGLIVGVLREGISERNNKALAVHTDSSVVLVLAAKKRIRHYLKTKYADDRPY